MGCDIHATIEYDWHMKLNKEQKWEKPYWMCFARDVDIDREYSLFGILAGVRHSLDSQIAAPRGIPSDATYEYKDEVEGWGSDGHSHSWVTFQELKDWRPTEADEAAYAFALDEFREDDWYQTMELLANKYGDESVRLCFFFDN